MTTISTHRVVPEASASGTAQHAEPDPIRLGLLARSADPHKQALARAARDDFPNWLRHVRAAAACARPVRLAGTSHTVEAATGRLLTTMDTASLPDGVVYKPCGNRRESVCPSCSAVYKRDAYQLVRAGLVGGKGVPEHVARHPAVFPTFTAPSFGEVHTRNVTHHTCTKRSRCDCRPQPCHPRREHPTCPHGTAMVCYARHADTDRILGTPLCLDCYDHHGQVVWNLSAGELWRRTTIAMTRHLRRVARARGIDPSRIRLSFGKAAEMQRRAVVHFHAIVRLDGADPYQPGVVLPPPAGIDAADLVDAVQHAVATVAFTTDTHTTRPAGWPIGWGEQTVTRVITVAANGEVTDAMVAAYLAKYATKSTETTGHTSPRLNLGNLHVYADPAGGHTERLAWACWTLGAHGDWQRLRRWAHMLGFGGHFFTKSRRYSITFTLLRQRRIVFRRTETTGPAVDTPTDEAPTTLVVNFLQFVGSGWHTTADAILANTSAALAREHQTAARAEIAAMAI